MAHLRSASPLLWMALLIMCTTIHVWCHTNAVNGTLLHTLAQVDSYRQHLSTPKHMQSHVPQHLHMQAQKSCLPPLSTNVFCCISMKSTVGEQDGIPHILQRYLRTSMSLAHSHTHLLSALCPPGATTYVMKKQFFIKFYPVKIN